MRRSAPCAGLAALGEVGGLLQAVLLPVLVGHGRLHLVGQKPRPLPASQGGPDGPHRQRGRHCDLASHAVRRLRPDLLVASHSRRPCPNVCQPIPIVAEPPVGRLLPRTRPAAHSTVNSRSAATCAPGPPAGVGCSVSVTLSAEALVEPETDAKLALKRASGAAIRKSAVSARRRSCEPAAHRRAVHRSHHRSVGADEDRSDRSPRTDPRWCSRTPPGREVGDLQGAEVLALRAQHRGYSADRGAGHTRRGASSDSRASAIYRRPSPTRRSCWAGDATRSWPRSRRRSRPPQNRSSHIQWSPSCQRSTTVRPPRTS